MERPCVRDDVGWGGRGVSLSGTVARPSPTHPTPQPSRDRLPTTRAHRDSPVIPSKRPLSIFFHLVSGNHFSKKKKKKKNEKEFAATAATIDTTVGETHDFVL